MINELDVVVLIEDFPEYGLKAGDDGTVVHVFGEGAAYLVEFMTPEGATIEVVEVEPDKVRRPDDRVHSDSRAPSPPPSAAEKRSDG